jgi:hypothetical protein
MQWIQRTINFNMLKASHLVICHHNRSIETERLTPRTPQSHLASMRKRARHRLLVELHLGLTLIVSLAQLCGFGLNRPQLWARFMAHLVVLDVAGSLLGLVAGDGADDGVLLARNAVAEAAG